MAGIGTAAFADGWDPNSKATNIGSITNTRHNLTLDYLNAGGPTPMDFARNNYTEVCVYCHTPHGANSQINAPLWNRTVNPGNYTVYDRPTTLGLEGRMNLPGPSSLTCLSCHDGTIAIDSILNMPGSGGYGNNELGTADTTFLDTWPAMAGRDGTVGNHFTLGGELGSGDLNSTCGLCHSTAGSLIPDFRLFMLGTDLRNDHVVGITYPTTFGPGIDYNEPEVIIPNKWSFFDSNGNNFAEKDEVRLYDSGNGPAVECASCHDPHGIPSNGPGTEFIPSFLRISNSTPNNDGIGGPSGLCLTCHAK
ncbi:MAG: cytochrome c3 family protein [Gammaproteobacteria bacterium]|nr:cytochrome c3 family protein [Gammaproteobacteria bacterium]